RGLPIIRVHARTVIRLEIREIRVQCRTICGQELLRGKLVRAAPPFDRHLTLGHRSQSNRAVERCTSRSRLRVILDEDRIPDLGLLAGIEQAGDTPDGVSLYEPSIAGTGGEKLLN